MASTIFAPITAELANHPGRHGTYAVLAAILAAVTIPAQALALPHHTARASDATARTRPFLTLTAGLTLSGFAVHAVVIGLVPLLTARGAGPTTVARALGRTLYATLSRHTRVRLRTAPLIAVGGATTALLALVPSAGRGTYVYGS